MTNTSLANNSLNQSNNSQSKMMAIFKCWKHLNKQRKYLRGFKPDVLNDIGFSQQQALATAKNPFWH